MSFVGMNIGALTVKVAVLRGDERAARVVAHQGRPLQVLDETLAGPLFAGAAFFGVSGHLGHIPESAAIQRALRETGGGFDAVASLGGESFLVYLLTDGRISNVLSPNKCAAGSGEFFVQQLGRIGLALDDAIRMSFDGTVIPLASRCSVHCKSDITHKLNRNEATPADVLRTLHDSMAAKVVALLERGPREVKRVLLIGGVTRNRAMIAALREKLPALEFVVLPESPWFEAWGTALITRDQPTHASPAISRPPPLGSLPPLDATDHDVHVIAAQPRQAAPEGPLVLGVDAGSTTTKAVLIDPVTRNVVASHYTRTRGDPVAASRDCLRALAGQVGNHAVGLACATGSARELVGAYLGTAHVYNEISAHAAGATHFDADVDTIFEIGGQDSKYIHLRNGVPIDYAMNNACSAGTGSFLEESAQSDLGIGVADIAGVALAAPHPVRFKATCAAFINSDIRLAQQQGLARDDIVAGLVYAIADNYLAKVKGQRGVGQKVFLQGGVALNRAVGHAFARSTGRPVVIPPSPELLGALGVGLLGLARSGGVLGNASDLMALAAPDMTLAGRFSCRACAMHCRIDRFEVAGRRFPFGGRCSLYESVWMRKSRVTAAPDLVEERAGLVFGLPAPHETQPARAPVDRPWWDMGPAYETARAMWHDTVGRSSPEALSPGEPIGIPRALTTHSLFPLYSTFLARLGLTVVLSDANGHGEWMSHSGFCFPAQLAHGAVLDLARRGVRRVFLPHVVRMPHAHECRDSYLCPITQAGPYVLAKAFPAIRVMSPELDFTHGYGANGALVEMAVRDLGLDRERAADAWAAAVSAQLHVESALHDMGRRALAEAVAAGKPAILLAGHSYNAFAPEASQSIGRKLASMGVTVIPADCLAPVEPGPTAWHFANQIMNAVALVKEQPNLFLLCVSNFSCTIDAFTHAMFASALGRKPYLVIEIDAHTADAGVQTRLEAFLDIIRNYREAAARPADSFSPCRLGADGVLTRSNGESVRLTDPRVKIYFPNFSDYHAEALALAVRWVGLNGGVIPLYRSQLERGLRCTSGRECLPLPVSLGQLLEIHDRRPAGEISGFYMVQGGAPCVSDAYLGYFERFLVEQRLTDLFLLSPSAENHYLGFDAAALAAHLARAVLVADLLVEVDHVLCVVGTDGSRARLHDEWQRFAAAATTVEAFQSSLPAFIDRLAALPRSGDPRTCPRVVVTGDFFTRFSPFFMDGVRDLYARRGVILKPVDLSDFVSYAAYHQVASAAGDWGMKPGSIALAKACSRIRQTDGKQYVHQWLNYQGARVLETVYRHRFQKTGLLVGSANDASALFAAATEHVSPSIYGEIVPTVGKGLAADREGYDGLIVIGPFNCLPFRISEAILTPLSLRSGMPILTYESDGYAVSPAVLRQVDVHIQQVLERAAAKRTAAQTLGDRAADLLKSAAGGFR